MARARILVLGGTGEGFHLAERLAATSGFDVISSLAGRTPAPKVPVGEVRRGGFGGPDGLARYLRRERISAVIDATHPFASRMSLNAASACAAGAVPVVHIWRPGWVRQDGDDWREVDTVAEAAAAIPDKAGLTFLTTGKTRLHAFSKRHDVDFLARVVSPLSSRDKARGLPSRLTFIYDRGPFALDAERRLLEERKVALIVTKNSGGDGACAKLVAAREMDVPVIMVRRPDQPDGTCVVDGEAALCWLTDLTGLAIEPGNCTRVVDAGVNGTAP